jgi:dTDP-4-dehydrorhamnose reductase
MPSSFPEVTATILITGAGGQVGNELAQAKCDHRLVALKRDQLDVSDAAQVEAAVAEYRPDIVINAAAYTRVDQAESDPGPAYAINRDAVAHLAGACTRADIPMLHLSTDYVFDGSLDRAYRETDAVAPLGVYGASKAAGEEILRSTLARHLILRTSWVFSATGGNFVKTMLRLGAERDQLGIVDDQRGCPTSARSIATVLLQIAGRYLEGKTIAWGTFHYCNQPDTSWYGFAEEIFRRAGESRQPDLRRIATREYPTPAKRPLNSVLDCAKIESEFGLTLVRWTDELEAVLNRLAGE